MYKNIITNILIATSILFLQGIPDVLADGMPRVELQTSMGNIILELDQDKAPRTVKNFLDYVKSGFYDDMIFHRVVADFVIQAGAFDKDMVEYETKGPIRNEATNGLQNVRGSLAMARNDDPNSADSQFFINLKDNPVLDFKARTMRGYGYCVFGRVVDGMDVVDAIGQVKTHEFQGYEDVPVTPVIIKHARVLD